MDSFVPPEKVKEALTNEALSKRFKSTFDLVNYAIKCANQMIAPGHAPRSALNPELNIANAVLDEIEQGYDRLKPLDINELNAIESAEVEFVSFEAEEEA